MDIAYCRGKLVHKITQNNISKVIMAESIIWKTCPAEIEEQKRKVFGPESNQLNGIVSVPYGIHANQRIEKVAKKIIDFELRPDDIWIVTYPKCGTTLTQVRK